MLSKDNRDNLGSYHSLWLAKANTLPNNNFLEGLFTKIEFTQNTGTWNKPLRNSVNGSYYEHTLQFTIPKYRSEVESFLLLHIDVPLVAYIKTHNGDMVRIGTKTSPFLLSSDFSSGTGAMGFNSYTFSGRATEVLTRNFSVTLPVLPTPEAAPEVLQNARLILSVRRVRQAYLGSCFTLRRDSDNATQNFGFLPNGELDIAAIAAFKGTASLFVRSWYDQSGNNYNFFQIDPNFQPQLLLNGNAGRAEIIFSGSRNTYLEIDTNIYSGREPRTMLSAVEVDITSEIPIFCFGDPLLSIIGFSVFFISTEGLYVYLTNSQYSYALSPTGVGNFCFTWKYPGPLQNFEFFKGTIQQTLINPTINNNPIITNGASIGKFRNSIGITQEIICCDGVINGSELTVAQQNIMDYFNLT